MTQVSKKIEKNSLRHRGVYLRTLHRENFSHLNTRLTFFRFIEKRTGQWLLAGTSAHQRSWREPKYAEVRASRSPWNKREQQKRPLGRCVIGKKEKRKDLATFFVSSGIQGLTLGVKSGYLLLTTGRAEG